MSKSRSSRRSSAARRKTMVRPSAPTQTQPTGRAAAPSPSASRHPTASSAAATAKTVDFASEYRHVIGDLRRLGILAAASFAVLIVLALVLR